MSALDVIRKVESLGGRLVLDDGALKLQADEALPDEIANEVSELKAAIMVALGAPLDTVVSNVLEEIRPHLSESLRQLPDDRLLVLVNWNIITAWTASVQKLQTR